MSPVKNNPLPDVIGSTLKAGREARKLERAELANFCCLSSKMILELEEGGMSSFYSFPLKISAAKRVGNFLNLAESDYLEFPQPVSVPTETAESPEGSSSETESLDHAAEASPIELGLSPVQNEVRAVSLDPAITERLEWQELLIEKVGGNVSGPDTGSRFSLSLKLILFLSLGLAITGLLLGLNTKYDLVHQVAVLMEPKSTPLVIPVENSAKDAVEEVKVAVQAEPAPSQEVKVTEAAVSTSQCPYKPNAQILSYQTPNPPSKPGDIVNLKTLVKQTICFVDGTGKQMVAAMEANTAFAFKGVAPFTVLAQDLDGIEMYFQGWKVRLPATGTKQVKLLEVN